MKILATVIGLGGALLVAAWYVGFTVDVFSGLPTTRSAPTLLSWAGLLVLSGLGWIAWQMIGEAVGDWVHSSDSGRRSRLTAAAKILIVLLLIAIGITLAAWTDWI